MAMKTVSFNVVGKPATKGSWGQTRTGRVFPQNSKALRIWTKAIQEEAHKHAPEKPGSGPVFIVYTFYLQKPKALRDTNTAYPIAARSGDGDKLERALWDALTGIFYEDDVQIVDWLGRRRYGSPTGVAVELTYDE